MYVFTFTTMYICIFIIMLKLATINVGGLQKNDKRLGVFKTLLNSKIDIVALQETHCSDIDATQWKGEWPGVSVWSTYSSREAGVAILYNPKLNISHLNERFDGAGRIVSVKFKIQSTTMQLVNV